MKKEIIDIEENICIKISYIVSAIIVAIIGYFLSFMPNELDIEYITLHYIPDISNFVAEKSEMLMYAVLTITFPILFLVFSKLFQVILAKIKKNVNKERISNILSSIITIILLLLTYKVFSKQQSYIDITILKDNSLVLLMSVLLIILMTILCKKNQNKRINNFFYLIYIAIIGIVSYLFINPNYQLNFYMMHHVDAYYYPIQKIIDGLTPGIDFNSLYGYYSYFYAVILQFISNINRLYIFSIINTCLVFIILAGLTYVANKLIKNKIITLLTILSIIFVRIIQPLIQDESYYLQYMPHRMIFPVIMLVYICFLKKYKENKLYKLLGFLIGSLAIFWNIETGIIVLAVWTLALLYETLYFHHLKEKQTWKKIGCIILGTIGAVIGYFLLINIITLIRAGQIISIADILSSQTLFAGTGFYMLRMPLWHPWLLLVALYGIALSISLSKLKFVRRENNIENFEKNLIVFTLAILGMGIFSYYEGRSHWTVFLAVTYPGILLLGIFIDEKLKYVNHKNSVRTIINTIIAICGITFLSVMAVSSIYYYLKTETISNFNNKQWFKNNTYMEEDIQEMREIEKCIGNIQFIIPCESYYYLELDIKDTKKFPAYVDIFTYEDIEKISNSIKQNEHSWCIQEKIYNILYNKHKVEIDTLMENTYTKYTINDKILLVQNSNLKNIDKLLEL